MTRDEREAIKAELEAAGTGDVGKLVVLLNAKATLQLAEEMACLSNCIQLLTRQIRAN